MNGGPLLRTRKNQRIYNHELRANTSRDCTFCAFYSEHSEVVATHRYFWIIDNIYGYQIFDTCPVDDHQMIVPKRHVHELGEFTPAEQKEYFKLIANAEAGGYEVFSRPHGGKTKSIPHQHTHMIKTAPRFLRWVIYLRRPHIMWFR